MSIYCPYCGEKLPDGSRFCFKCGKKIPDINNKEDNIDSTASENITPENSVSVPSITENTETEKSILETIEEGRVISEDTEFDATKKGKSIASLVLGILGVICLGSWFSLLFGVIGLCIGASAMKHKVGIKGLAIAGIILSIVAIIMRIVGVFIKNPLGL